MTQHKRNNRRIAMCLVCLLFIFTLLGGCAQKTEDVTSLPKEYIEENQTDATLDAMYSNPKGHKDDFIVIPVRITSVIYVSNFMCTTGFGHTETYYGGYALNDDNWIILRDISGGEELSEGAAVLVYGQFKGKTKDFEFNYYSYHDERDTFCLVDMSFWEKCGDSTSKDESIGAYEDIHLSISKANNIEARETFCIHDLATVVTFLLVIISSTKLFFKKTQIFLQFILGYQSLRETAQCIKELRRRNPWPALGLAFLTIVLLMSLDQCR